jgi:hypothetical protein
MKTAIGLGISAIALTCAATAGAQDNISSVTQTGSNADATTTQSGSANEATVLQSTGTGADSLIEQNGTANVAMVTQSDEGEITSINKSTVIQTGERNSASLVQESNGASGGHTSVIQQIGDENLAQVNQLNFSDNSVINQQSDSNIALVDQGTGMFFGDGYTSNNRSVITQSGDGGHTAIVSQDLVFGSRSDIEQVGATNFAQVTQTAFVSSSAIIQEGEGNVATTTQGSAANLGLLFDSASDLAFVKQVGDRNGSDIVQNGETSSGLAEVRQDGDDGSSSITQTTLTPGQEGEDNEAKVEQLLGSSGNISTIAQAGSENEAFVTQGGADNLSAVTQAGLGNVATVAQN